MKKDCRVARNILEREQEGIHERRARNAFEKHFYSCMIVDVETVGRGREFSKLEVLQ